MFIAAKDRAVPIAFVAGIFLAATGCNSIGAGKQLKQLELENNRLLSEFRAERQRRESAERTAQQLETRLAESEKMLARQLQGPAGPGRLSSLPLPSTAGSGNSAAGSAFSGSGPAYPGTGSALSGPGSASSSLGTGGTGLDPTAGDLRWHRRN